MLAVNSIHARDVDDLYQLYVVSIYDTRPLADRVQLQIYKRIFEKSK